ncbi:serine/arginine repetitive matrix protein 1-like [Nothobranchius furzeri]|uniref:Serine/arginine repetitive matrix protein 1-like n=1 Tax=Nothobranchius furzeri TaxID=105023 RepID=A0A9D2YHN4_NOTFU|nr:serine/arginine repetitive matrix protein 1-like [Nothobranchius furzeri]
MRRSESSSLLGGQSFDGAGRSQGTRPISPLQNKQGQGFESGTLPRNFKSLASSVKSQSNTVSDFRSALRKNEVNSSSSGRGSDVRSSSPPRRDHNSSFQIPRNTEGITSLSQGHGGSSRASSPSRRTSERMRDSHFSSLPSRNFSRNLLRKSESAMSLNEHSHHGRCGSPIREGYSIEGQTELRNQLCRNGLNDQEYGQVEEPTMPLSRQGNDRQRPSILRKTESNTVGSSRDWGSCSSSPGRRGHETLKQHQLRSRDLSSGSVNGYGHKTRNSSPSRRNYEAPSQSLLHKSKVNSSVRSHDSYSASSLRKTYDASDQRTSTNIKTGSSLSSRNQSISSYSPSRKGNNDPPGYSLLQSATNGDSSYSFQRKNSAIETKSNSSSSPHTRQGSTHSQLCSSLSWSTSKQSTIGNRTAHVTLETTRNSSSIRSAHGMYREEDCHPAPKNNPSVRAQSPSPSPQIDRRSSHRTQSPSPSSQIDRRFPHRTQSPSPSPQIDRRSSHRTQSPSPSSQLDKRPSHWKQSPFLPPSDNRPSHQAQNRPPLAQFDKRPSHRARSSSPPPQIQIQSHTSSQSSLESSESGRTSVGSTGRNKEEYAMMADLPKIKMIHQVEEPGHAGRPLTNQPMRRQELFKPARSD